MATRTIGNAGGTWSAAGTWVEGAVPTAADDVVATATSGNLTIDNGAVCQSLDFTGYVASANLAVNATLTIGGVGSGKLKMVSGMGWTANSGSTIVFSGGGGATFALTSAGKSFVNVTQNTNTTTTVSFQDAFTCSGTLTLTQGAWTTNNFSVTVSVFNGNTTNTHSITLGTSSVTVTGANISWNVHTTTGLTLSAASSTITMTGTNAVFDGAPNTAYGSVIQSGSGNAQFGSSGNTLTNYTRTGTAITTDTLQVSANITVTGTLTFNSNSAINRLLVFSSVLGAQRTITCIGATVVIDNTAGAAGSSVDFTDINIAGAPAWTVNHGTMVGDAGGNGGAVTTNATASAAQTWSGTSGGNWSTNAWSGRVPLPQDDVSIASAFIAAQTIQADMPRLGRNISWSGTTGTPTWSFTSKPVTSYGNVTLISGLSWTGTNIWTLAGRGSQTWTSGGQVNQSAPLTVNAFGGSYTFQDSLVLAHSFIHNYGTLSTNNFSFSVFAFTSNSGATRTVNMGTGAWTISGNSGGILWATGPTGLTLNVSTTTVSFTGNSGANTITTGGVTMPNITFNGSGGSWTQNDAITTAGTITLSAGTWATGSFSVTGGAFNLGSTTTRTWTPGSSTITLTSGVSALTNTSASGLTVTANTAVIVLSPTSQATTWSMGAAVNFNGASVVVNGLGSLTVTLQPAASTVANLALVGVANKVCNMAFNQNVTVTGTVALQGNSATNRLLVETNVVGTARTITCNGSTTASVTLAGTAYQTQNVDLMDITGAGSASWDLHAVTGGAGDCQGNSGVTFTPPVTRYWVGGNANTWASTASWSTSTGGASGATVPLPQDTANIDLNSGFTTGQTITIDMPRFGTVSFSGLPATLNWSLSQTSTTFGNYTCASGMVRTSSQSNNLIFGGRGSQTLTAAGMNWPSTQLVAPSGTYTQQDAYNNGNNALTVSAGSWLTGGFSVSLATFTSTSTTTRAVTLGTSTVSMTGTGSTSWNVTSSGLTLSASSSTITYTAAVTTARTFAGGGLSYGTLQYTVANSPGALVVTGANTFANLIVTGYANDPKVLTLPSASVTTVTGTVNLTGSEQSGNISLPGVVGSYISTPNAAWNQITGDLDLRCQAALVSWTPAAATSFIAKNTTGQFAYQMYISAGTSNLRFQYTSDGSTGHAAISSVGLGFAANSTHWVRATYTAATGNVTFYTSSDGITWTQLGTTQTITSGAIDASTAPVEIGSNLGGTGANLAGQVFKAQIYSGINGVLVGAFDATNMNQATGTMRSYTDTAGTGAPVWTVNGAANSSVLLNASTPGSAATLSVPNTGAVYAFDVDVIDNTAQGGATFKDWFGTLISNTAGWTTAQTSAGAVLSITGSAGASLRIPATSAAGLSLSGSSGGALIDGDGAGASVLFLAAGTAGGLTVSGGTAAAQLSLGGSPTSQTVLTAAATGALSITASMTPYLVYLDTPLDVTFGSVQPSRWALGNVRGSNWSVGAVQPSQWALG